MSDAPTKDDAAAKPAAAPRVEPAPPAAFARREIKPQTEMNFQEHGWKQMEYDCIPAKGVRPEDLLDPDYWAHVAQAKLRQMTKIYAMCDDGSWYGELIVWQTRSNGAVVSFTSGPHVRDSAATIKEETEFEVFHAGLSKKWSVRRIKDGRNFIEGKESEQEAWAELRNWLKAQGPRRAA